MEGQIGKRVAVPTHYYKIIVQSRPNGFLETTTFLLEHVDASPTGNQVKPFLAQRLTKIDVVEAVTGIDFFADPEDQKENAVEAFKATGLWATE